MLAWAALLGARARKLAPVGGTWALVGRMRAPPAPTCAPFSPTCAPRCASERRSGMLMLVVVRPFGGVVVLVISKKAPRPEWLFPLPEWLGVAPSGSEWLGVAPAGAWLLKDSACGLAHPPYGSSGSTSAHWCANGAQGIANERASCASLALASVHMCPTGAPLGPSGAHVGAGGTHASPTGAHMRPFVAHLCTTVRK